MLNNSKAAASPDYSMRGLNPERLATIEQYAGPEVLDVGCGNGAYVLHFANRLSIRGVDYQQFDAWAQRPELFDLCDAQQLDLVDDCVDTIISFETLEHLAEPQRALKEYLRVCRKNVILTVPSCTLTAGMRNSGLIYNHWIDRTHINFWNLDSICQLVRDTGFEIQHRTHINQINLAPLVVESMGLTGTFARLAVKAFRRLQRHTYPMTCLVVASKPGA